jgi:peptide/nickel transport system substrate-binding protein
MTATPPTLDSENTRLEELFMKRVLVLLSVLLFVATFSFAGAAGEATVTAGIAPGFDYNETYGTYHWTTPADFEKATGETVGAFKEAPMLADMVSAGLLPPVEERLPLEPLVLAREIGNYGGTAYMGNAWPAALYGATPFAVFGFRVPEHTWGLNPYTSLAKDVQVTDGGKVWTVTLREGHKWSDGMPFTSDDVIFWWEDVYTMEEPPAFWTWAQQNSKVGPEGGSLYKDIIAVDDLTIRFEFTQPTAIVDTVWAASAYAMYPRHYYSQFHPKYVSASDLDAIVKEGGFESWEKLFAHQVDSGGQRIVDRPIHLPWTLAQGTPGDIIMERNPYYWAVDPAGNQLPYLDELYRFMDFDDEVIRLKALAGEVDIARVNVQTYILAKEREDQGEIVGMWYKAADRVDTSFTFNLNHADPVLKELFRDKRFRFATSYAIKREEINQLVFNGMTQPWQDGAPEGDPYYHEKLATTAIEYDPEKAHSLMEEIGLERGSDGFYRRPDGGRLQIIMVTRTGREPAQERNSEMVVDHLREFGLDVTLKAVDRALRTQIVINNEHDAFIGDGGDAVGLSFGGPWEGILVTGSDQSPVNTEWGKWWLTGGTEGEEPVPAMKEAMEAYLEAFETFDLAEKQRLWWKLCDIASENLWWIGTVQMVGRFKIYTADLANWPSERHAWDRGGDSARPELMFFR